MFLGQTHIKKMIRYARWFSFFVIYIFSFTFHSLHTETATDETVGNDGPVHGKEPIRRGTYFAWRLPPNDVIRRNRQSYKWL